MACAHCATALVNYYYDVNGHTVCERCRYAIEAKLTGGSPSRRFLMAFGAGLGAAILGALVYYGVVALTGYEIGLIAIAVGYGVGTAVRWGSGGRGGRGYQILAVALTYLAIVSTYIPYIIQGIRQARTEASDVIKTDSSTTVTAGTPESTATPASASTSSATAPAQPAAPPGPGRIIMAIGLLLVFAAVAPFLGGAQNIIGIFIIAIGLWEAWKLTAKAEIIISGPHSLAPAAHQTAQA